MNDTVELDRLHDLLTSLQYPLSNEEACEQLSGVTLAYADGQEQLVDVVERANDDTFEDVDDLEADIYNNLPVEAVGEPGQSEGDA